MRVIAAAHETLWSVPRERVHTWVLRVLACATVALAPLEGYLHEVNGELAKIPFALLAVAWLVIRVRQRRLPRPHPIHVALALLAVVLLGSAAVHAAEQFTMAYTSRWLPFLALAAVIADVAARDVPIGWLLGAAATGATVAAATALYSAIAGGQLRAHGPVEDPNDLAYFLVAALPLLVALLPARQQPARRGVLAVLALAAMTLVAGVAATFSRGGLLALAAAVGWLVLRRAIPLRVVACMLAVLAVLGVAAISFDQAKLTRALEEKGFIAASNVDTRELRWKTAVHMLAEHPVLGVGPGGFRSEYAAASHNAEIGEQTPVAHNMYLEVAAELGLPGFALFLALLALAGVATERRLRASRDGRPMVAMQAALIAVAVASVFLSEQYYQPLWLLIGLAAAADPLVHQWRGVNLAGASCDQ